MDAAFVFYVTLSGAKIRKMGKYQCLSLKIKNKSKRRLENFA